jgi:hypothetical protein
MFFRVWFLYVSKIAVAGFALAAVGFATPGFAGGLLQNIGLSVIIPLGIGGALTAIVLVFKKSLACPLCGRQGKFVTCGKTPAINCGHCGLVYCRNPLTSFALAVEPASSVNDNGVI